MTDLQTTAHTDLLIKILERQQALARGLADIVTQPRKSEAIHRQAK